MKDGKLFRVSSPYLLDSNVDGMVSGGKLLDTESVEGFLDILAELSWDELVSVDASDEMLMEKTADGRHRRDDHRFLRRG